ncbi:MAG: DUF2808 domain-containing protein, partial [Prochlorothrix sp.]|nr:DUF2808 domain-containing protein [Prochlorothrix sp.]
LGSTLSLLGSAGPQLAPDPHPTLSIAMASAHAVQLADGKTHFVAVPRLTDTGSSNTTIQAYGARHYLTLDLPAEASEALGAVTIQQQEGSDRRWRYALDRLHAFSILPDQQRQPWPLISSFDRETHTLTLTFDPPVPPGTTLTLALTPRRNPAYDGIYLWGITAFPAGEDPQGQFLGYGRFHFYRPDRRWWW